MLYYAGLRYDLGSCCMEYLVSMGAEARNFPPVMVDICEFLFCEKVRVTGKERNSRCSNQHSWGFDCAIGVVICSSGFSNCTTSPAGGREGRIKGYQNGNLFSSYHGVDFNSQHIADLAAYTHRIYLSGSAIVDQYWSLFFGYSAIWILLVFYILSLGKKVRHLEERLLLNQSLNDVDVRRSGGSDDKSSSI